MPEIALSQLLWNIGLVLFVSHAFAGGNIRDGACITYYLTAMCDVKINWKK